MIKWRYMGRADSDTNFLLMALTAFGFALLFFCTGSSSPSEDADEEEEVDSNPESASDPTESVLILLVH